jgi:hypothetical protein
MNQQVKQKWVDALKSGDYQQTRAALKDQSGFCCLGVLCDLYSKETGEDWVQDGRNYRFFENDKFPPIAVCDWAGFVNTSNPKVEYGEERLPLTDLNDTGKSFKEIAAIIQEQL